MQKQRAQVNDVKKWLRSLELKHTMLYPARLQVVARDEVLFLKNIPWQCSGWIGRSAPVEMSWLDDEEQPDFY